LHDANWLTLAVSLVLQSSREAHKAVTCANCTSQVLTHHYKLTKTYINTRHQITYSVFRLLQILQTTAMFAYYGHGHRSARPLVVKRRNNLRRET